MDSVPRMFATKVSVVVNTQTLINQTRAQFRPDSTNQARIPSTTAAARSTAPLESASVDSLLLRDLHVDLQGETLKDSAEMAMTTASTR